MVETIRYIQNEMQLVCELQSIVETYILMCIEMLTEVVRNFECELRKLNKWRLIDIKTWQIYNNTRQCNSGTTEYSRIDILWKLGQTSDDIWQTGNSEHMSIRHSISCEIRQIKWESENPKAWTYDTSWSLEDLEIRQTEKSKVWNTWITHTYSNPKISEQIRNNWG